MHHGFFAYIETEMTVVTTLPYPSQRTSPFICYAIPHPASGSPV